jgi:hypothetical protein
VTAGQGSPEKVDEEKKDFEEDLNINIAALLYMYILLNT